MKGLRTMRILVIGGTGFIGPAVVHSLIESGHDNDVTLFHRGQTEADFAPEVKHIHCNDVPPAHLGWKIQGLPDFVSEFSSFAPDVVLDMVPIGEQDARVVMNTFRGIARRVVALISEDVYRAYDRLRRSDPGPPDPTPLTEDSPLREKYYPYRSNPLRSLDDPSKWQDEYDKILAERVVMSDPALPGTILRLPMVYGPRDYQHRLFEYLKRMDDQRPAILLDETIANWRWTRGYVEDVAQAIVLAVTQDHAAHRIYNVGEPHAL